MKRKNYYVKKTYFCADCQMRHKPDSPIGIAHRTPHRKSVFEGEWCVNCRERFDEGSDITFVVWGDRDLVSYSPIHKTCVDAWLGTHEHYRLTVREIITKFVKEDCEVE